MTFRPFVLTALVLFGCHSRDDHPGPATGSGSAASNVGSAADPCRYATNEEVGAAIGAPIVTTERKAADQCAYYPTPPPSNGLYIRVSDSSPYASMKQMMRNTETVAGVGDDAIWAAPQLIVKAGTKMITIGVMDVRWNHGDSKAAAVAVARAALPHVTQ